VTFVGAVTCNSSLSVAGLLETDGNLQVDGNATTQNLLVTGTATLGSGVVNNNLTVHGTLNGTGGLTTTTGYFSGAVTVDNNVNAAAFNSNGSSFFNAATINTLTLGNVTLSGVITGNVAATGQVTGSYLGSTGNINAAGSINAASYQLAGQNLVTTDGTSTAYHSPGGIRLLLSEGSGGYNSYNNVAHYIRDITGSVSFAIFNASGSYNVTGSWNVISDDTVKTDVTPYSAGLDELLQLNPVSFQYTERSALRGAAGSTHYGLMASEVATVLPEMVNTADLGGQAVQTLQPGHLHWICINAIKELSTRLDALEAP
jgi:cytoskeletal protein CcmA (bactofilin family)